MPVIHDVGLDRLLFPQIAAGRTRYMAFSKSQASERIKIGLSSDRKDFFHYLLKAVDPITQRSFSTPELVGESNLLM